MEGDRRKSRRNTVHRRSCGLQDKSKRHDRNEGKEMLRRKVDEEGHMRIYGGVERGDRDENISAWPNGRGEKFETAISGGGPGPARKKKKMYQ